MSRDYYNQSNLYVCSDGATKEQVTNAFKNLFRQISDLYPNDPEITKATFLINVVESRPKESNGKPYPNGLSYAWVSSPKIYNILIGKAPDGKELCKYVKPEPEPISLNPKPKSRLWGDIEDEEETIKVMLPPLVTIPPILLTSDQIQSIAERQKIPPEEVAREVIIRISQAYIVLPESIFDASTICCRDAPQWVTKEQMLEYFERFNTDPALYMLPIDKVDVRIHYPQVRIKPDKNGHLIIFVAFSKSADHISNASFALQMCRKGLSVTNPETGETSVLSFSFWRNKKVF